MYSLVRSLSRLPRPWIAVLALVAGLALRPAPAATLTVAPAAPQPGDVLTLTVFPAPGEKIQGVEMAAFNTNPVKFYPRPDGSERAFLGFPFNLTGGLYPLTARVRIVSGAEIRDDRVQGSFHARSRVYPTQYVTMKPSTAHTMSKHGDLRAERIQVQSAMQDSNPAPLWTGAWIVPASGKSTSSYGRRRYVNGKWWGQHNGADIRAVTGTLVRATNAGRVVLSEYLPTLRGNCIVLDHGCNVYSVYMHLSKRLVSVGEQVQRGQTLGRVGATGFVTGPHLHWEIRIGWEPVDPFHVVKYGLQF